MRGIKAEQGLRSKYLSSSSEHFPLLSLENKVECLARKGSLVSNLVSWDHKILTKLPFYDSVAMFLPFRGPAVP